MAENTKIFKVGGMKCGGCVTNVTNAVKELAGIEECNVSLDDATATVAGAATADEIINAITSAGFQASQMS
jgi:copper chaperone CopZ